MLASGDSGEPAPVASVIVPCYRAEGLLAGCVSGLLAQAGAPPFEILLVENGSPDATLAVAERLAGEAPGRIRVLVERKPGAYAARNRGLREARGRFLLFTDADCIPGPGFVRELTSALQDPEVLIAGGEVLPEASSSSLIARYSAESEVLSQAATLRHPLGGFFQTANLAVRRDDALAAGGFDETLFTGGDADFCWRLRRLRRGGGVRHVAGAEVRHRHREDARALYRQYRRYGEGDVLLARRWGLSVKHTAVKLVLDALRVAGAPLLALAWSPSALRRRDPLPIAAPWLRALRVLARRSGQLRAWLLPGRLHRS